MKNLFKLTIAIVILNFAACIDDTGIEDPLDIRDKIEGNWNVNEYSETFKEQNFTVTIQKDAYEEGKILIYNFFNLGTSVSVYAYIEGSKITIPTQTVQENIFEGTGQISSSYEDIDLDYMVDFQMGTGAELVNCTMTTRPLAKNNQENALTLE